MMRSFVRVPRARFVPSLTSQPCRFAHSSYGNKQSGHEQDLDKKNPKEHLEHPGPESPATQGSNQSQGQSSSSQSQSSGSSSGEAKPTIQTPKSEAENESPEVKKHNEEMAQRPDRSVNQLSEEDNKVDKKFWKGDVGDMSKDKSSDSGS